MAIDTPATPAATNPPIISFKAQLILAFAAIYIIWGSTYLGIRFAVETIPPFFVGASRFLMAGTLLMIVLRARGVPIPTRTQWRSSAIVGALLLLGGNGGVTWAEQSVPSGLAALLVVMTPMWMALLNWLWRKNERPAPVVIGGLLLGFGGVALLVGPDAFNGSISLPGVLAIFVATLCWSVGSLYARDAELPPNPLMATCAEMLCGGVLMVIAGVLTGDGARLDIAAITPLSWAALIYLAVFGSIIAFSAYVWLLGVTTPARVATYAYVNPVVAVILGVLFAGEILEPRTLIAAPVIIAAVVMITSYSGKKKEST